MVGAHRTMLLASACTEALQSEQGKLNKEGTQEWYSCMYKEVWSDQGQLKSRSTGDCGPAYAYAAEMDLWKLNGQTTQISDIK
jgi:hypothetical protein